MLEQTKMEHFQIIAVFLILGGTFLFFVKEWLPADLVALGAFALCIICQMLSAEDVAKVFQNGAPLTIGAMFVLSAALARTGVINQLAHVFQKMAGKSETRGFAIMALIVLPLSACINNTPLVVVFLPVVLAFARSADIQGSRLLMPLSFLAILGGTMSLFGSSSNILVAGVATGSGLEPFGVFEIAPLGILYALIGTAYLFTIGRKLLPDRPTLATLLPNDDSRDFLSSATVMEESPLVGKKLEDTPLWKSKAFRVFYLVRRGQRIDTWSLGEEILEADDVLVLKASQRGIAEIAESSLVTFHTSRDTKSKSRVRIAEAMIGPQSDYLGKSLRELRLHQQYGIIVAALHRKGANLWERELEDVRLNLGDTLLLEAPEANLARFQNLQKDLIFLNTEVERPYRRNKAPLAIAIILAVVILAAFGVPILSAAIVGAVAVMILGCVDPREAYDSVEWPILFIIFGMLGLGQAMENTGAAKLVAEGVTQWLSPFGPLIVLAVIYLLASTLTEIVTNNAVAVLMTPIVITIAEGMGVDPRPFVVAIMFGASASFATPIGYQTNTYVFSAGGYRFADFVKVGLPLNLILWLAAVLLIPLFWPF
ncbi:SLC13 family permease [Roseibacillus ishigakijimensis]|uniref:SLC13 family permease n=1 Tax=Roseibacillus ishigakijimensis TaxID=454146 RepID=A0A934RS74_9BACT|nr:SLC13 family permease [Roseibacillus ishigakijimensis]MBK1833265.1 SLC13 family permease [Roseibacillus ishigakijimensis]